MRFGRLDVFDSVTRDSNAHVWLREMCCEVIGTRDPAGALGLLQHLQRNCVLPPALLKLVDNAMRGFSQQAQTARKSPSLAEVVCASCGAVISYGPVGIGSDLDAATADKITNILLAELAKDDVDPCPVCGGTTRKMRML
jgi:hypothetical protein